MMDHKDAQPLVPCVIAIVSGKGGTGKTSIAINLASALFQLKKKVFLLDADFGIANIDLILKQNQSEHNIESVLQGQIQLEDILLTTKEGFSIIPGGRGRSFLNDLTPLQFHQFITTIDHIKQVPDFLLIDTSGSIHAKELQIVASCDHILVVITPETLSLHDSAEYIRQIYSTYNIQHFSIITNQTKTERESLSLFEKLQHLVGFDVDVVLKRLSSLSKDNILKKSLLNKTSVIQYAPTSRLSRQFITIAEEILIHSNHKKDNGGLSFFLDRHIAARRPLS